MNTSRRGAVSYTHLDRGIRLKSTRGRGGIVEDIRVSNIVMSNIMTAVCGEHAPGPGGDRGGWTQALANH